MPDRDFKHVTFAARVRERSIRALNAQLHRLADVLQSGISQQRTGQQSRLAENLEAVADTQHQPAVCRKAAYLLHNGRKFCYRTSPQVVAISKSTGDDNGIAVFKVMAGVPKESDGLPGRRLDRIVSVVIAIGSGKDEYAEFHG